MCLGCDWLLLCVLVLIGFSIVSPIGLAVPLSLIWNLQSFNLSAMLVVPLYLIYDWEYLFISTMIGSSFVSLL